jgi:hypothetical protein
LAQRLLTIPSNTASAPTSAEPIGVLQTGVCRFHRSRTRRPARPEPRRGVVITLRSSGRGDAGGEKFARELESEGRGTAQGLHKEPGLG